VWTAIDWRGGKQLVDTGPSIVARMFGAMPARKDFVAPPDRALS
jgi:hypothetical protein